MFRTPTTSVAVGGGTTTTATQLPNASDMVDHRHHRTSASRNIQFHPARPAIIDLFNLYLGRNGRQKSDDSIREPPNKTQKRVTAPVLRDLPPRDEQFLLDFEQLQNQFPDREQLRAITESVLISLIIQCSDHAPRSEFILFALHRLYSIGYILWDSFIPSLLSSFSQTGISPSPASFQSSNPESPLSPVKSSDNNSTGQQEASQQVNTSTRQVSCKIIVSALETNLKMSTHADILYHMLHWLVNWDQRQADKALFEWLHKCLDVVWILVEDKKCRVPFYELIRSGLQFIGNIPDDEVLFTLILEVHRRRDMMAMHMQMLDQHLHCPTFGNQRLLCHPATNIVGESATNMRYSPIAYPSALGEPLNGEDIALSIQRGSFDWERALRCIRHALRNTPSPDWWRRVLLVAPCHRLHSQGPTPGAVFSSDMICEATIDRIVELLKLTNSDINCWQEWLIFSDLFFFLVKSGCIDFVDFVDKLVLCMAEDDHQILKTNHITWLFAQISRVEIVMSALNMDSRKVETTKKVLSFHKEDRSSDANIPESIILDFISSCQSLRIWSLNPSTREFLKGEQLRKGKEIDEWWKQVSKGEHMMDYMNLDDKSIGMLWVVSYTMAQPACEMVMTWLTSAGHAELQGPNDKISVMREVNPVPISLLLGFSINSCHKLAIQMEDVMFYGQHVPNIAMVETYTRLLLIQPHSLFRSHLSHLHQRNPETFNKPGATLLVLEILNYRLFSLYRYQGKSKTLMYDVTKILSTFKGKRGDHRVFRLAENLCMNLIMSLREFFFVRKEGKGPTEFTETLNRITVMTLAIIIKTRGIADVEHLLYLQTMLEQILATSQHTWSEKTLRYFPAVLRDALIERVDKRSLVIQAWQQAEATVIHQCTQLLSPPDDPTYVITYISHSFPQHRQYLCAGAWVLMRGHPENINSANLGRVLREFSPEEVTANIYTMVDVLLRNIQLELQHGHSLQDLISNVCANLAHFIWNHELLPLDILLLALIDRDDDPHALRIVVNLLERQELQQRIKFFVANHGKPEHWLQTGIFKRVELQTALGNHLSWKERSPPYFDDIAARLLPVIPLIIYRLIENEAIEAADRVLQFYSTFLHYYPLNFTFVRDLLAYFYSHLPQKLIFRILTILDIKKIPFSDSFLQHVNSSSTICPPLEYFSSLLSGLVNNIIPPLSNPKTKGSNRTNNSLEGQKAFYQIQDPGTCTQLILETAVIEILSIQVPAAQIVSAFVQIIIQSNHGSSSGSVGGTYSLDGNGLDHMGLNPQFSCVLLIQACGLLLAQLPVEFHVQLYAEVSRVIKESWWLTDRNRFVTEIDCGVGYALLDPTWAVQDNTSTALGNVVALLHAFFSNLPQEWLDKTHLLVKNLRPVSSVAVLRIAFRIIGPLLPRLANAHSLFTKKNPCIRVALSFTLAANLPQPSFFTRAWDRHAQGMAEITLELLLSMMVDVFGKNTQPSTPVEASDITDIIDFLHHIVLYEGQGGPVQPNSKPRPDVLALCGKAIENMRVDVQHLLSHLKTDPNGSIYAATHPKLFQSSS